MDGRQFKQVMEDESGTDGAECCIKVMSGRKVLDAIRSIVNAMGL